MLNYILPQIRKRNHAALHFTKEILEGQNLFVIKIVNTVASYFPYLCEILDKLCT